MKLKPIPTVNHWGFLSETFLICDLDGKIKVKDGRTLEEYINDPRIVARRKKPMKDRTEPCDMVVCTKKLHDRGLMGQVG